jgi:hypothetical protein
VASATGNRDERRLRRSSTLAGVGDGVVAVALPLLAAELTRDPLAVAAVLATQHLPWIVVHLLWRRLRSDRRTLVGTVDTLRALTLGYLGFQALLGHQTLQLVHLAAFVVGLGEALTDRTESDSGDVSGLSARGMVGLAVVGLPLGGVLYEVYPATPFLFEVLAFAAAALFALLVGQPVLPVLAPAPPDHGEAPPGTRGGTGLVTASAAIAAGAASAVLGVLVLFALDDLGLGAPAFGVLVAGLAVCTAVGGLLAPEAGALLGVRRGLILALVVAGAGDVAAFQLADPELPILAAVGLGVTAGAAMLGGVLTRAHLQLVGGRPVTGPVLERFHLVVWGAIPVGAVAGGLIARERGVAEVLAWAAGAWLVAAVTALSAKNQKIPENDLTPRSGS